VIELAYFADLSQTQIAARLGVPLGTVKSWTRRSLNHLATLLGEETSE
jgi:RNA polymerase sigma-70 factor (ECF subfamily)